MVYHTFLDNTTRKLHTGCIYDQLDNEKIQNDSIEKNLHSNSFIRPKMHVPVANSPTVQHTRHIRPKHFT